MHTRRVEEINVYTIAANRVIGPGNYIRQEGYGIRSKVRFRYRLPGSGRVKVRGTWELWNGVTWLRLGHYPELSVDEVWLMLPGLLVEAKQARADGGGAVVLPTCGDVLRWYCERQQQCAVDEVSVGSKALIASHLKCWLLPALAKVKVSDLSRTVLEHRLFARMRTAGLKPATQDAIFKTLRAAVRVARDAGLTGGADFLALRLADFQVGKIEPRSARLYTHQVEQMTAVVKDCLERYPVLGMLLLTMLAHGTRIGETRQARLEDFDLEARVWIIPAKTTKTRTRHVLPLTDAMVQCMASYRRWRLRNGLDGPWLFTDRRGRPLSDGLARAWVAWLSRSAGLTTGDWSAHDLRKLARTCWWFQGAGRDSAEALLNHAQSDLFKAYMQEQPVELMRSVLEVWHGAGVPGCVGLNLASFAGLIKGGAH